MAKMIQVGGAHGVLLPIECLPFLAGIEKLGWTYHQKRARSFISDEPVEIAIVDADSFERGDPEKAPDPVVVAAPVVKTEPDHQAPTTGSPFVPSNEVLSVKPSDLPAMRDFVDEWR